MESNNVNTPLAETNTQTSNAGTSKPIDNNVYLCRIECAIRRKPNTIGLPGQDPAERTYRIGASLDNKTRGNLKGITDLLETKFMPEIIGLSINDPLYRKGIEDYWSSISKVVPHDEITLKEHEKGLVIKIEFHVIGKSRKESFDALPSIVAKVEQLNKLLVTAKKDLTTGQDSTTMLATIFVIYVI